MTALTRTSPTPDAWEQLANTLVATQTDTQDTAAATGQALAELRAVAPVAIRDMTDANAQLRDTIARIRADRAARAATQGAAVAALQNQLGHVIQTETNIKQDIDRENARIEKLKSDSQATGERIKSLLSPAGLASAMQILSPELRNMGMI